jgi:DNA-binding CsgD family transcriptional regulator
MTEPDPFGIIGKKFSVPGQTEGGGELSRPAQISQHTIPPVREAPLFTTFAETFPELDERKKEVAKAFLISSRKLYWSKSPVQREQAETERLKLLEGNGSFLKECPPGVDRTYVDKLIELARRKVTFPDLEPAKPLRPNKTLPSRPTGSDSSVRTRQDSGGEMIVNATPLPPRAREESRRPRQRKPSAVKVASAMPEVVPLDVNWQVSSPQLGTVSPKEEVKPPAEQPVPTGKVAKLGEHQPEEPSPLPAVQLPVEKAPAIPEPKLTPPDEAAKELPEPPPTETTEVLEIELPAVLQKKEFRPESPAATTHGDRDSMVLGMIAFGFTNAEIASQMGMSVKALEKRLLPGLYREHGAKTRQELISAARKKGDIKEEQPFPFGEQAREWLDRLHREILGEILEEKKETLRGAVHSLRTVGREVSQKSAVVVARTRQVWEGWNTPPPPPEPAFAQTWAEHLRLGSHRIDWEATNLLEQSGNFDFKQWEEFIKYWWSNTKHAPDDKCPVALIAQTERWIDSGGRLWQTTYVLLLPTKGTITLAEHQKNVGSVRAELKRLRAKTSRTKR